MCLARACVRACACAQAHAWRCVRACVRVGPGPRHVQVRPRRSARGARGSPADTSVVAGRVCAGVCVCVRMRAWAWAWASELPRPRTQWWLARAGRAAGGPGWYRRRAGEWRLHPAWSAGGPAGRRCTAGLTRMRAGCAAGRSESAGPRASSSRAQSPAGEPAAASRGSLAAVSLLDERTGGGEAPPLRVTAAAAGRRCRSGSVLSGLLVRPVGSLWLYGNGPPPGLWRPGRVACF